MRIQRTVIIGAGAVGASTAAQMALRGTDHLLIGRGEQIRRIAESGLRYIRPDGEHTVQLKTADISFTLNSLFKQLIFSI